MLSKSWTLDLDLLSLKNGTEATYALSLSASDCTVACEGVTSPLPETTFSSYTGCLRFSGSSWCCSEHSRPCKIPSPPKKTLLCVGADINAAWVATATQITLVFSVFSDTFSQLVLMTFSIWRWHQRARTAPGGELKTVMASKLENKTKKLKKNKIKKKQTWWWKSVPTP